MKNIKFDTGDVILYKSDDLLSSIIQFFTDGEYYHCSMILKDPIYINKDYIGKYIIESTYRGRPEYGTSTGVQILPINTLIDETFKKNKNGYNEKLFYRKLNYNRDKKFYRSISKVCKSVYKSLYDIDVRCFIYKSMVPKNIDNIKENRHEFSCSTLLGYIYRKIGLLSEDINWTKINPSMFSSISKKSLTFNNATLDEEIRIV